MGGSSSKEDDPEQLWLEKNLNKSKSVDEHKISDPKGFKSHIHVKFDEDGKIIGMPELWVDLLKISPEMVQYAVDTDELDEAVAPIYPDEKIINQVYSFKPGKFIITLQSESDSEERKYDVEIDETEEWGIKGLPAEWKQELKESGFTKKDVIEHPMEVLETLNWMRRTKTGSLHPLPTNSEYRKREQESIVFIKSNPSKDYIILDELGEGGFGKVYKCVKISNQEVYAMKHIDITSNKQKIYIGNEITLMKSIDHKNIVKLYETYMYKGRIFLFMEFLDGGCLTPVVEDFKLDIPENVIAYIITEVLQGIVSLHKRGIVHRDIKSDNVLIERDGAAIKLTDFGYSCQLTQEKRLRESRVGTLYWMAPEILKGNWAYDERCDIWSLGVFAFELAEGVPPFPKKGQQKTIYHILSKPAPELKNKKKWSEEFQSFISYCMIKDPEERPKAKQLLKHPFINELDYEEAQQEYIDFKYKVLKSHGKITADFEESKFEGFTSSKRLRSNTVKDTQK